MERKGGGEGYQKIHICSNDIQHSLPNLWVIKHKFYGFLKHQTLPESNTKMLINSWGP